MDQVKVFYDRKGSTLTVWFGNPLDEYICEETGDEVILMKDKDGQVIGFEKLHFSIPVHEKLGVAFEAIG
jgi:uncharacterized protein YuzE